MAGVRRNGLVKSASRFGFIQTGFQDSRQPAAAQAVEAAGISVGFCGVSGVRGYRFAQWRGNGFHGVIHCFGLVNGFSGWLINQELGVVIIQHGGFILEVSPMRIIGL
ncbi:hypothetical protein [Pseudomonas sp. H1h]|uniref:hypothetical protein n=1 Tax=Pseudomonas sp. H1h TaxID=1397280 RepID=UPI00046A9EC4|nr:hypothetical protein [Pseudomonas sp. H1h]